ncbi:SDR family NAD(P)-dependent oxidoreductase [uncultured Rhodoblastus sp.]|uniref:SDR family oxidoreductase n=1 Tax=uncultured Rhodoblastus sp. TaxID=543037 RepID=UPI0025DF8E53|nr:SDR family NAD(P)-dependent oxidoreductase [uncultured Rhodoblastus sp.]
MKTALITGAASRLGVPMAHFFAGQNYRVLLHVNRSRDKALELARDLAGAGARAQVLAGDFTEQASIAAFCEELTTRFGAPDVIVNNASVFEHDFPGEASADKLAESLSVHAMAPFMILEAVAAAKHPQASVTAFNILDQKLLSFNADYYSYTLGKSALMALTSIWQGAGRADMRVFGLLPGLMFPSGSQTQERFDADQKKIPTGRATPAEDICALMGFFLAHPDLPGQMLPIDGGEHLVVRRRDIAFE